MSTKGLLAFLVGGVLLILGLSLGAVALAMVSSVCQYSPECDQQSEVTDPYDGITSIDIW